MLSGCATPISRVSAAFNCQDYANAWARNANRRGIIAGVIHYKSNRTPPHAICWAVDPDTSRTVFIEPQGCARRNDPANDFVVSFLT